MSRYISNNTNRNQLNLIPMSLDEMISEDNSVRVFDAFVGSLNLNELGFKYATTKTTGRKPYN
ncbi:MAG: IS5/IS1182 family transposase, partial [Veillonellales bacterium]